MKRIRKKSAMAIVFCGNKILATKEMIFGREKISLPKGGVEKGEKLLDTAVRECAEETGVLLDKKYCVKKIASYKVEFVLDDRKVSKTIYPFLFKLEDEPTPNPTEKNILSAYFTDIEDFLDTCSYANLVGLVKKLLKKG